MLQAWLDWHRATLAMKCDGLGAEELRRRSVPPSTLSLLGLVRHMAEVERGWFRRTLAGEEAPALYYSEANPDGDFDDVDAADPQDAFAAWQDECRHAAEVMAGVGSLDQPAARPRDGRYVSARWILVHMIEEYARHNGHADLLRQRIDGATGE
ncbi:MAG TPA: DinB family protein [Candidatus Dormibacteraeota bacterium]